MSLSIKVKNSNIFRCNTLRNLQSVILDKLDSAHSSYDRDKTGQHMFICEIDGERFIIKWCFYRYSVPELYIKESTALTRVDTEIKLLGMMKNLLNKNYLNSVVEMFHIHTCDNLDKLMPSDATCNAAMRDDFPSFESILCSYKDLIANNLAINRCTFIAMEYCDITLSTFLEKYIHSPANFSILRIILFQIIFAIYVINEVYPGFHHYDLHTDNVMLKINNNKLDMSAVTEYPVGDTKFYVPVTGITAKIIDFEFAAVPTLNIISYATLDRRTMYERPDNDIVLLLFWMYMYLRNNVHPDIDAIFKSIEPHETYKFYNMAHIREVEGTIPNYKKMLKCDAFKEFLSYPSDYKIKKSFARVK